jgi:1-acyl-sn-glycerol-3-phosphate acyltransferase
MQDIIVEKPYQFQAPFRRNWAPWLFQKLRLVDRFLKKNEGIESYEIRGLDYLRESLRQQCGILLAPNHCRYADPLVMGWVVRPLGIYLYAMASWHLFNEHPVQSLAIRLCGGFSINREGIDRQALDTAIGAIAEGQRPLVIFPEGTVFRSNDLLHPLLDGVAFVARSAARRRAKLNKPPTVIHPIAIKYLYKGDIIRSITPVVAEIENRLAWFQPICRQYSMVDRVKRLTEAFLATKELEHLGQVGSGDLRQRRSQLIENLLIQSEHRWLGKSSEEQSIIPRIKALRLRIVPELLQAVSGEREQVIRCDLNRLYVAQQIASYPDSYLEPPVTNTRLLETVEQLEEDIWDKARVHRPLHAIIEVCAPIIVSDARPAKGESDPILVDLENSLRSKLAELAYEAAPIDCSEF